MPLQATSGAASYDGFGGGVPFEPIYIEQIFATHLYTGNGSTQTITNGIDLSGKGGLVWIKNRSTAGTWNDWFDTARGATKLISSNQTDAQATVAQSLTAFTSSGFSVGTDSDVNQNTKNIVSWTFRKQAKFFDVVTYTGNDTAGRQIAHSLGSVPGCIIIKCTSTADNWIVYHRSIGNTKQLTLNTTDAQAGSAAWNSTDPTSTVFTLGSSTTINGSGRTYVAYLFAHDAGGFGLTGADNVISCGSFTTDGSGNATVTLGYEPQWYLIKRTDVAQSWFQLDTMRGWTATANTSKVLIPNLTNAESTVGSSPTATGFTTDANLTNASATYIYIAIRRGPMKTPTSGTSVYNTALFSGNDGTQTYSNGFPTDFILHMTRTTAGYAHLLCDRLRGKPPRLDTTSSSAESNLDLFNFDLQNSVSFASSSASINASGTDYMQMNFRRAPGFFDEVCYTGGTGTPRVLNHNLAVAPELLITRVRNFTGEDWIVHYNNGSSIIGGYLNSTSAFANSSTAPSTDVTSFTATTYTLNTSNRRVNGAYNYVAYLFATVAGVSKVGSYTGTGTTKQIDCGFTGGARFVLIKRTDSTGDWYVWDSARGIVAGNDPYLLLNSTAAEVTNTDYVDTYSAGFEISSTAPAAINANGGSFVFLAIA